METYAGFEFVDDILQAVVECICGYFHCTLVGRADEWVAAKDGGGGVP